MSYPRNAEGKRHGKFEHCYENGKLYHKGEYINGKRHGFWEWYHENGRLYYQGNFKDDIRIGFWLYGDMYKTSEYYFYGT